MQKQKGSSNGWLPPPTTPITIRRRCLQRFSDAYEARRLWQWNLGLEENFASRQRVGVVQNNKTHKHTQRGNFSVDETTVKLFRLFKITLRLRRLRFVTVWHLRCKHTCGNSSDLVAVGDDSRLKNLPRVSQRDLDRKAVTSCAIGPNLDGNRSLKLVNFKLIRSPN